MKFVCFIAIISSFIYFAASCKTRINRLSRNIDTKHAKKPIDDAIHFNGNDDTAITSELQRIIKLLDKEWQINKAKTKNEDIPSVIMDKYEYMNTLKNRKVDTIVRCSFNTETNIGTGIFRFNNLGDIDPTTEVVTNAELYVYSDRDKTARSNSSEPVTVRLYQIVPTENQNISSLNPDFNNLLTVAYVPRSKVGWQVFNVKPAVENWLKSDPNLGILLVATDILGKRIYPHFVSNYITTGPYRTFLLMQFRTTKTPINWPNFVGVADKSIDDDTRCSRKMWNITFDDFGWYFIIKPKSLFVNKCSGNCAQIHDLLFNHYELLVNFYSKRMYGKNYTVPCCVPIIFNSTTLIFYDYFNNIVIKDYPDMIVERCGCR